MTLPMVSQNQVKVDELLKCFLSGRNRRTLEAYRIDLSNFSAFMGDSGLENSMSRFVSLSPGEANGLVLRYRNHLVDQGLQSSTINRRLAAIRSLVKLARTLGIVTWSTEIQNLKVQPYRDVRGPGLTKFCEFLDLAEDQNDAKAKRDIAILRLLFDLALRASELTGLDLDDFDPANSTLAVLGKGKTQKVHLTLPEGAKAALESWIAVRGIEPGALFLNFDRARERKRLSRNGLYELIRKFGLKAGIKARPHGLRHLAVTEAIRVAQINGFGLDDVLDFSRHASVQTLMMYNDREKNTQGQIANLISGKLDRAKTK